MVSSPCDPPLEALSRRFEQFAEECRFSASPLYKQLSSRIAADPEILALAAHARSGPLPNLFFAAAHLLLLKGTVHPVSAYYASLSMEPRPAEEAYPHFRQFCLAHSAAIQELLSARRVQTNEVRRCACLLPAFGIASDQADGQPLALVEIGASAGLNLLWDRYGYQYGDDRRCGAPNSTVQISCALRGEERPPIPAPFPEAASRVGLDLNPIDLRDPEAVLWLRALIWPDHRERADLLQRAIALARADPPPLIAGDALARLPGILDAADPEAALCVFHTHTVNQFSPEARERLTSLLAGHGARRDLWLISMEGWGGKHALLELVSYRNGSRTDHMLARCSSHGGWLEWLMRNHAR